MDGFQFITCNSTSNCTSSLGSIDSSNRTVERSLWIYAAIVTRNVCIPLFASIGFVGNTTCILVFSAKNMKKSACSVFLESLALVDNVFLLSLLISWIDGELYPLLGSAIQCQIVVFSSYVTSFLSVWLIVGFTIERFIAVRFPLKSIHLCSVFKARVAVVTLTLIAVALYQFSFWTTHFNLGCSYEMKFLKLLSVVTWIDTFLTFVIPFFLIVVLNSVIVHAVINSPLRHAQERRYVYDSSQVTKSSIGSLTSKRDRISGPCMNKTKPQIRVTRLLLFVSYTFFFLNLPAHSVRLYTLFSSATGSPVVSGKTYFFQELTLNLYYVTFCTNFFLYTFVGGNFRKTLYAILQCKTVVKKSSETFSKPIQRTFYRLTL